MKKYILFAAALFAATASYAQQALWGQASVVSPEINAYNKIIFRDNNKQCIKGKSVMLMLATTTTGETIRRAMECIEYYGGHVVVVFPSSVLYVR